MKKFKNLCSDSLHEFKKTRTMALCAMMAALAIILGYTTTVEIGPFIKIGFSEIPNRITEFLFGPIIGGSFGGALDILKYLVKPTGPFFIGFTFSAIVNGIIYGVFLYNKPVKIWRIIITEFLTKAIVNCGLNTLWLSILYGKGFMILLSLRLIKNLIMLPIDSIILLFLLTYVEKTIKPLIRDSILISVNKRS